MERAELVDVLERTVFRLYRSLRRETALQDLSPQDPVLLKQIARQPGVGVASLAGLERLRAPTVTSHINRLEKAGMVRRKADPSDGRRTGLHITAKGRKAIDLATQLRHDYIAARLDSLTPDERHALEAAAASLLKISGDGGEAFGESARTAP